MILDVHADIVSGNKSKRALLLGISKGAELAGLKLNITSCEDINDKNFSLLWRYPTPGETRLENIIKAKDKNKLFFINSNYCKSYHVNQSAHLQNDNYRLVRYSIYDNEAIYPKKNLEDIEQFYRDHDFEIKPWKKNGSFVIIIPNKSSGFGRNGLNVKKWVRENIKRCMRNGYKNIVVQIHPKEHYLTEFKNKVRIEKGNIKETFKKYDIKFAIIYNSGAVAECMIEGIPSFVQGPNNPARHLSNMQDLNEINYNVDRNKFVQEAAQKMWNIQDIVLGKPWKSLLEKM